MTFLTSFQLSVQTEGCLSLTYYSGRYHADNDDVIALRVSAADNSPAQGLMYELPATLGSEPIRAFIPLPLGQYDLVVSALVKPPFGELPDDVICVDDIEVHQKSCDDVRCDDPKCEEETYMNVLCGGHGTCLGRGLKHAPCHCNQPYIGKECDFSTDPSVPSNPYGSYQYYG